MKRRLVETLGQLSTQAQAQALEEMLNLHYSVGVTSNGKLLEIDQRASDVPYDMTVSLCLRELCNDLIALQSLLDDHDRMVKEDCPVCGGKGWDEYGDKIIRCLTCFKFETDEQARKAAQGI